MRLKIRATFLKYDEGLFKLVDEVYKQSKFRYVRYDQRKPAAKEGAKKD